MIRIEVFTKNMALQKTIELETDIVPRIGETIFFKMDVLDNDRSHLVHDVIYNVSKQGLTPVVYCHEATPGEHRKFVLEEHGWL